MDSDVQEVSLEVKEDFVRRAVLLMHAHPMVSKIEDGSFFFDNISYQEEEEEVSSRTQ